MSNTEETTVPSPTIHRPLQVTRATVTTPTEVYERATVTARRGIARIQTALGQGIDRTGVVGASESATHAVISFADGVTWVIAKPGCNCGGVRR